MCDVTFSSPTDVRTYVVVNYPVAVRDTVVHSAMYYHSSSNSSASTNLQYNSLGQRTGITAPDPTVVGILGILDII